MAKYITHNHVDIGDNLLALDTASIVKGPHGCREVVDRRGHLIESCHDLHGRGPDRRKKTLNDFDTVPGNYTLVTVDNKGRVIYGSRPTTLTDLGIYELEEFKTSIDVIPDSVIEELLEGIETA